MSLHHWSDAAAYLKPSLRDSFLHGPDSAPINIASISHIQVIRGGRDHADETGDYGKLFAVLRPLGTRSELRRHLYSQQL